VRPAGADIRRGATALEAGATLDVSELALAAALGLRTLPVHRAPRVALLATGDELAPLGSRDPRRVIDSNSVSLAVRLRALGCQVESLGIARDRAGELRRKLRQALRHSDVVLTIAGASVGDRDLVKPVLRGLGAKFVFERVAMRPGKPVGFARLGKSLVFTLPGNPVSARVTLETLVLPAIDALQGRRCAAIRSTARLAETVPRPSGVCVFPRVCVERRGLHCWAVPQPKQNSGYLTSLVGADALAVIPATGPLLQRGSWVELIPL
jgi:molybdopterin molybdotransferase